MVLGGRRGGFRQSGRDVGRVVGGRSHHSAIHVSYSRCSWSSRSRMFRQRWSVAADSWLVPAFSGTSFRAIAWRRATSWVVFSERYARLPLVQTLASRRPGKRRLTLGTMCEDTRGARNAPEFSGGSGRLRQRVAPVRISGHRPSEVPGAGRAGMALVLRSAHRSPRRQRCSDDETPDVRRALNSKKGVSYVKNPSVVSTISSPLSCAAVRRAMRSSVIPGRVPMPGRLSQYSPPTRRTWLAADRKEARCSGYQGGSAMTKSASRSGVTSVLASKRRHCALVPGAVD